VPACCRPEGTGTRKLAPGRDGDPQAVARKGRGPAGCRPEGTRTRRLSSGRHPPLSPRPGQAVAVARGAGVRGAEDRAREPHGSATGATRIRDGSPTPSRRCRELHAPSRVVQHRPTRCVYRGPHRGPKTRSALSAPGFRPEKGLPGPGSVTFPASSSPIRPRCGGFRTTSSRKSDLLPSLRGHPHGSPTSRRPCDAFQPEASRPGLLMGVTACQDPHEEPRTISDGRSAPEPPPVPCRLGREKGGHQVGLRHEAVRFANGGARAPRKSGAPSAGAAASVVQADGRRSIP